MFTEQVVLFCLAYRSGETETYARDEGKQERNKGETKEERKAKCNF